MITRFEKNSRLSKAVSANGFVFLSGITPEDVSADITGQTRSVLAQIERYLEMSGTSKERIVSANIWLSSIADAPAMNAVWETWVDADNPPARATVESKLNNPDMLVEIMVQAVV